MSSTEDKREMGKKISPKYTLLRANAQICLIIISTMTERIDFREYLAKQTK